MVMIRELSYNAQRTPSRNALGRGAYRMVFSVGTDYVLKIDTSAGRRSNKTECVIWDMVKGTDAEQYFVPILARNGTCDAVIQPRVTVMDTAFDSMRRRDIEAWGMSSRNGKRSAAQAAVRREQINYGRIRRAFTDAIQAACEPLGIQIGDLHDGNIGYLNGRMVVLDYGNFNVNGTWVVGYEDAASEKENDAASYSGDLPNDDPCDCTVCLAILARAEAALWARNQDWVAVPECMCTLCRVARKMNKEE